MLAEQVQGDSVMEPMRQVLAEALATVNNGGERAYEAELYRLKGEFLLIQAVGKAGSRTVSAGTWTLAEADHPMLTEAETCFRQAIADSIIASVHHYMLKDTTVASGKWEGMRKEAHCDWMSGYHGYFPQGAPRRPRRSQD